MVHCLETLEKLNDRACGIPDLMPFCGEYRTRFELRMPFCFRGWKYYTDSIIAVRIKTDKPDTEDSEDRKFPRDEADKIFSSFDWDAKHPVIEFPTVRSLFGDQYCEKCQSVGWIDSKYDPVEDTDSEFCECNPKWDVRSKSISGVEFSIEHWLRIERLPGVCIVGELAKAEPAKFMFDAGTAGKGHAVLMPCIDLKD